MRKRFEQQLVIGATPIERLIFPQKSRDELPSILWALKWIYTTPEINEEIFALLEEAIMKGKKRTGRNGMTLWQILVLGVIRLGNNTNWDKMEYLVVSDQYVRQLMGLGMTPNDIGMQKEFSAQSLRDNAALVDDKLLEKINAVIVKHGRCVFLKKKQEDIKLRVDGIVVETDVHFPTDLNLEWDALRKASETMDIFADELQLPGWRKNADWRAKLKNAMRGCSRKHGGINAVQNHRKAVENYLELCREFESKLLVGVEQIAKLALTPIQLARMGCLKSWVKEITRHIDLIDRRHLKGETIPHKEKKFSLFEPHTQMIIKGKANKQVEFGVPVFVATDQFGLVVAYTVMEPGTTEKGELLNLVGAVRKAFGDNAIASISTDKGSSTKENREALKAFIPEVVLPKIGKKTVEETQDERAAKFRKIRNQHSAVESDLNCLEHHGFDRCPDVGLSGFKRYVGFAVVATNLHKIGREINLQKVLEEKREHERTFLRAA